jgi:2-haloacid dehalogenase
MDFSRFTAISFDCYGTLIEWEAGILPALRGVLERHGKTLADAAILELYGEFEEAAERGVYQGYRNVLHSVVQSFSVRMGFSPTSVDLASLSESVASWAPFADTVPALRQLKSGYRMAVISNIDDALFAETRKHLGIEFDAVITSEQAGSYKPSLNNFKMALRALSIGPESLVHVGQSIFHDVLPAQSLGISTVWVNRKSARPGVGAVRSAQGRPDLEVPDLASLAAMAVQ